MEVYFEYVLLDNFIIDYLLLALTAKTLQIKTSKKRIVFSSIVGAVFAVSMPLISIDFLFMMLLKIIIGAIMILIFSKYSSLKQFIATFLFFITYTFAFGGIILAVFNLFGAPVTNSTAILFGFEFPISIIVLFLYLYFLTLIKLTKYMKNKMVVSNFSYVVLIKIAGKTYKLSAFLDSGNEVVGRNSEPVIIISLNTFEKLFKDFKLHKLYLNTVTDHDLENSYYIEINTVSNKNKMLVFKPDSVDIILKKDKIKTNALIGVAKQNFKDYDCLLNKNCLNL